MHIAQQTQWKSIFQTTGKSIFCTKNMLCGSVTGTLPLRFPIISITLFFKNCCSKRTILVTKRKGIYWPKGQSRLYRGNRKTKQKRFKVKCNNWANSTTYKKIKLRIWGYTNGEYLYMLPDGRLTLKYKTYTIKLLEDALEAWKELILNVEFGI